MQQSEELGPSHEPKLWSRWQPLTYDPRLPNLQAVQGKHWTSMTQDAYLKSVFRPPPLTAYRRQKISRISLLDKKIPQKKAPSLKYIPVEWRNVKNNAEFILL